MQGNQEVEEGNRSFAGRIKGDPLTESSAPGSCAPPALRLICRGFNQRPAKSHGKRYVRRGAVPNLPKPPWKRKCSPAGGLPYCKVESAGCGCTVIGTREYAHPAHVKVLLSQAPHVYRRRNTHQGSWLPVLSCPSATYGQAGEWNFHHPAQCRSHPANRWWKWIFNRLRPRKLVGMHLCWSTGPSGFSLLDDMIMPLEKLPRVGPGGSQYGCCVAGGPPDIQEFITCRRLTKTRSPISTFLWALLMPS